MSNYGSRKHTAANEITRRRREATTNSELQRKKGINPLKLKIQVEHSTSTRRTRSLPRCRHGNVMNLTMGCEKERRRLQRQRTKRGSTRGGARLLPEGDRGAMRGCGVVRLCERGWPELRWPAAGEARAGKLGLRCAEAGSARGGLNGAALVSAPAGLRARDWGGSG